MMILDGRDHTALWYASQIKSTKKEELFHIMDSSMQTGKTLHIPFILQCGSKLYSVKVSGKCNNVDKLWTRSTFTILYVVQ